MANYFQGAKGFTINGGTFGQDYSRHITYRGPVHRTNDYSQHTTNYDGYVNYGQHSGKGGTINNNGPQTTNNGPIHGYQQYAGSRSGSRRRAPQSPPPDVDEEFDAPPPNPIPNSRPRQQHRRRYPPPPDKDPLYGGPDSDRNFNDDNDDHFSSDEDGPHEPPPPPPRAQRAAPRRRPQAEQSGDRDISLDEELRNMSPEMQRYVQKLMKRNAAPVPPERDILDRMADMQLDDAEPSRAPAGRNSPRARPQQPPRRTRAYPAEVESDSDGDFPLPGHAIVTNTDSQNVNHTTVVDSHNDNSTRTEMSRVRT
jgi:hypothetical protein